MKMLSTLMLILLCSCGIEDSPIFGKAFWGQGKAPDFHITGYHVAVYDSTTGKRVSKDDLVVCMDKLQFEFEFDPYVFLGVKVEFVDKPIDWTQADGSPGQVNGYLDVNNKYAMVTFPIDEKCIAKTAFQHEMRHVLEMYYDYSGEDLVKADVEAQLNAIDDIEACHD
jgi:hypothetical protein